MGGLSLGTESLSPPIHYGSLAAFLERRLCAGSCYTLICRGAFSSIDRPLLRLFEPGRRAQIGFRDPPPTPKRSAGGAPKPHSAASPFVRCVFPPCRPTSVSRLLRRRTDPPPPISEQSQFVHFPGRVRTRRPTSCAHAYCKASKLRTRGARPTHYTRSIQSKFRLLTSFEAGEGNLIRALVHRKGQVRHSSALVTSNTSFIR